MGKDIGLQLVDQNDVGTVMDLKINPQYDANGKIISGVVVGNILEQNKALILLAKQGEIKFRPDLGVGIEDVLLSDDYLEYRHTIREHFAKDTLKISTLQLYKNKPFIIEATYGS
ncbi:hypothetical protein [Pseudotamlana carrageenivorans]|uniref:Uncharacterized protein n=1 Tax=Pseudotamlana carrageenivorans TaxID=2069432 RepID=A0A2I7SEZ6_9FLAO|nr:hypothetical protein [Tamlana carrageenivorans]AUS04479.1 hypothetical protein C1A40_02880 [Tamlana carrageenivorans]